MQETYLDRAGKYVKQTRDYSAFVPKPLPPDPALRLEGKLLLLLSEADQAIGRLDASVDNIPNPEFFVAMFSRNEAVYSSQIEGTQTSLTDLLFYEFSTVGEKNRTDTAEVMNYVNAMRYGLERLNELPLSLRLLKEIHGILLENVRGGEHEPGQFRRNQVHVGPQGTPVTNARYVPPPPNELQDAMSELERFIHGDYPLPKLIKCGLVHAQFEMIHPFNDGNGRIGRLLVTFLLCWWGILKRPLLYISDYFKQNRQEYYDALKSVSDTGDWESWMIFFLQAVKQVSLTASDTARQILLLKDQHRRLVSREISRTPSALLLLDHLYISPVVQLNQAAESMGKSKATANKILGRFVELGILSEVTGQTRNRLYLYKDYVDLFEKPSL